MATETTGIVQALPGGSVAPRAPLLGLALLALWLGLLLPVFRSWSLPPSMPGDDAQAIVAQLARIEPGLHGLTRTTAFLRGDGCRCAGASATSIDAMPLAAWPAIDARPLAASSGLAYPVVVLAPGGRLLYAGPSAIATGCGTALPLSRILPALLAASRPALIIQSTCSCTQE